MTISSNDIFLAVLAMDSYNRGPSPGLKGLQVQGGRIGDATIIRETDTASVGERRAGGRRSRGNRLRVGGCAASRGGLFSGLPALMAATKQMGADVLITLGPDSSVLLQGVQLATLEANDFLLA